MFCTHIFYQLKSCVGVVVNVEWISNICLKFKTTKCVPFQYSVVCFHVPILCICFFLFFASKLFLVSSLQILFFSTLFLFFRQSTMAHSNSKYNRGREWDSCMKLFYCLCIDVFFFVRDLFEWFSFYFYGSPHYFVKCIHSIFFSLLLVWFGFTFPHIFKYVLYVSFLSLVCVVQRSVYVYSWCVALRFIFILLFTSHV